MLHWTYPKYTEELQKNTEAFLERKIPKRNLFSCGTQNIFDEIKSNKAALQSEELLETNFKVSYKNKLSHDDESNSFWILEC